MSDAEAQAALRIGASRSAFVLERTMDVNAFWLLNENLPVATAAETLKERLSALSPDEIASYQMHFDEAVDAAYQWRLWGAAYVIGGGCSDDGFIDFRYGLISRGHAVYERALADADSLIELGDNDDVQNELFGYVALELYEEKTGRDAPRVRHKRPPEPVGENWDFDDPEECRTRLPKLWARYGG